jgi:hypothetical protein
MPISRTTTARIQGSHTAAREAADGSRSSRPTRPTVPGPVAAALLAAGVGSTVLGLAIVAVEASPAVEDWAAMGTAAGPLTGKALVAAAAFLIAWAVLRTVLGTARAVSTRATVWSTSALVAIGVLFTFPPVYGLFHGG